MYSIRAYYFLIALTLFSTVLVSCEKEDNCKGEIIYEVTLWEWELEGIYKNGEVFIPKKIDYMRHKAYTLVFLNDSTFSLQTSVNSAGGKYQILNTNEIFIDSYREYTKVGQGNRTIARLDENLILVFNKCNSFQACGSQLTFYGSLGDVIFKKGGLSIH